MEADTLGLESAGAAPGSVEKENSSAAERDAPRREGRLQKCFEGASRLGPLLLICVLALYVWPAFLGKTFPFPPESESGRILRHVMQQGAWMAPSAGEVSQLPGFSALFAIILKFSKYFGETVTFQILTACLGAFCSLLTLLGVWCLSVAAGFGPRAALSAGLILLCAPVSAPLANFVNPETLAVALTLFSFCCFCRGWQREGAGPAVPSGFLLAALAALTGGLYYLFLPFLSSLIFLCWISRFRRAQKLDAVLGFALSLALIAAWLGGVMFWGDAGEYFQQLRNVLAPSENPLAEAWRSALIDAGVGLLGLFPWLGLVVFVSWPRVVSEAAKSLKAARAGCAGAAFVWIALACAVLLSPVASGPIGPGVMICGLAALLLGKALPRLSNTGSRFFYLFVVLCLLVAAAGLTALSFNPSRDWLAQAFHLTFAPAISDDLSLPGIGLCCLTAAFILVRFTNLTRPAGSLLACVLLAAVLVQPVMLWLEPRFWGDSVMLWRRDDIAKNFKSREQSSEIPAEKAPAPQSAPNPEQSERTGATADVPEASRRNTP
jgi:4-amino-4-deoxy-L-arabinose transferase-like glycosyltransferase